MFHKLMFKQAIINKIQANIYVVTFNKINYDNGFVLIKDKFINLLLIQHYKGNSNSEIAPNNVR